MYKNLTVISQNGFTAAHHAAMTSWHRPVHSLWGRWLMHCGRDTHLVDICTPWAHSSWKCCL